VRSEALEAVKMNIIFKKFIPIVSQINIYLTTTLSHTANIIMRHVVLLAVCDGVVKYMSSMNMLLCDAPPCSVVGNCICQTAWHNITRDSNCSSSC
jgi:hypothetical protein